MQGAAQAGTAGAWRLSRITPLSCLGDPTFAVAWSRAARDSSSAVQPRRDLASTGSPAARSASTAAVERRSAATCSAWQWGWGALRHQFGCTSLVFHMRPRLAVTPGARPVPHAVAVRVLLLQVFSAEARHCQLPYACRVIVVGSPAARRSGEPGERIRARAAARPGCSGGVARPRHTVCHGTGAPRHATARKTQ